MGGMYRAHSSLRRAGLSLFRIPSRPEVPADASMSTRTVSSAPFLRGERCTDSPPSQGSRRS